MRYQSRIALLTLTLVSIPVHAEECPKPELSIFKPGDIRLIAGIKAKMMESGVNSEYLKSIHPDLEARAQDHQFVREMNLAMTADFIAGRRNLIMRMLTPGQFTKYQQTAQIVNKLYQRCLKQEAKYRRDMGMVELEK